jgi:hypothetical protein
MPIYYLPDMRYLTTIGDKTYVIEINQDNEVIIDGQRRVLDMRPIDDEFVLLAARQSLV